MATLQLPGGGTLRHFPLVHPGGSIGFRLDWPDRSLAYVTDTKATADAAYIEHIRGVSVLVHEAYFDDGADAMAEKTGHSCLSDVARVAAAAEVGLLVLVHVDPRLNQDSKLDLQPSEANLSKHAARHRSDGDRVLNQEPQKGTKSHEDFPTISFCDFLCLFVAILILGGASIIRACVDN